MGPHVGALGLTLVAYWYVRLHAGNDAFSFGTGKVYSLAGYTSGVLLAMVAIYMAIEGIEHLVNRHKVDYLDALPCAVLGRIVTLASATILGKQHQYGHDHDHHHHHEHHHHEKPKAGTIDFNLRAAYIHILADAMTSVMAIFALSLGLWKKWWFLDPIMG